MLSALSTMIVWASLLAPTAQTCGCPCCPPDCKCDAACKCACGGNGGCCK